MSKTELRIRSTNDGVKTGIFGYDVTVSQGLTELSIAIYLVFINEDKSITVIDKYKCDVCKSNQQKIKDLVLEFHNSGKKGAWISELNTKGCANG